MAKQASHCKECGKELSFISKRLHEGLCTDCFIEATKPHCKECGKKLPAKPDLSWDGTEYLVDVCSDCEFVEDIDGEPVNPDKFTARYVGGYGAYPEPQDVLMLTYPDHLEVPELGLTIPYNQLQNVQSMTEERYKAGRFFLVGLYAFAWKKRTPYLIITFNDVIGIEQNPVFDLFDNISEVQLFLYQQMVNARKC
jgi:hypothetical protein